MREGNSTTIIHNLLPGWMCSTNYNHHPGGRVWIFWDPNVLVVQVTKSSEQIIHVQAMIIQQQRLIGISCIYGFNTPVPRRDLWSSLYSISSFMLDTPWLVMGDFNIFRQPTENLGGATDWPAYVEDLNECCHDCLLEDLRFTGHLHTWTKGSGTRFLARKLDRALINSSWMSFFPNAEAVFQDPGASDHTPIVVNTGIPLHHRRTPFRFFNFWLEDNTCEAVISQAWSTQFSGSP